MLVDFPVRCFIFDFLCDLISCELNDSTIQIIEKKIEKKKVVVDSWRKSCSLEACNLCTDTIPVYSF